MNIIFIMLAIMGAWILQTILGASQVKNFNLHYVELRQNGRVSIGRSKGILRTGVVLLMSIDKNQKIKIAKKMQGVTILARFKEYPVLEGQDLLAIQPETYEKMDRFTKQAFDEAVDIYKRVANGEEIPPAQSPFSKLITGFGKS